MIVFCIMASFIKNKGLVFHYSMKVHHSHDWFLHRGFIYLKKGPFLFSYFLALFRSDALDFPVVR